MFGSILSTYLEGARLNAILVAAIEFRLADHLARERLTVPQLAERARISERGCQAVADGMVALKLWRVEGELYENTPTSLTHLVRSAPSYVGDEHPDLYRAWLPLFARTRDVVRTGETSHAIDDPQIMALWPLLTPALARSGGAATDHAVRLLNVAEGSPHVVDVGGGAAALYACAILPANQDARVTQVDWPHVNAAARDRVAMAGVVDRFSTVDGDFRSIDLGAGTFDIAILSHVLHLDSPASNRQLLAKIAGALKPGGRVLISEWVVDDGRTGPPPALIFNTTMLLLTPEGKSYERKEFTEMLLEAGFEAPEFTTTASQVTLVVARKRA